VYQRVNLKGKMYYPCIVSHSTRPNVFSISWVQFSGLRGFNEKEQLYFLPVCQGRLSPSDGHGPSLHSSNLS
jgi:hypothetical protein